MIKLNKKQRKALRILGKLPTPIRHNKVMEHRRRIQNVLEDPKLTRDKPHPSYHMWRW